MSKTQLVTDTGTPYVASNNPPALSLADWLAREIPPPDCLLAELLNTSSRMMLVGPTGLGKTMLGLAIGFAVSLGQSFLHWRAGRKARVLYVDGEMSARSLKKRLRDAARRASVEDPDEPWLIILSREDHPDMPPLNTPAGQKWMDRFMLEQGAFDLVIFDNVQALTSGQQKEEETWLPLLPWVRDLTRRHIGQIWFHHTGHNEDHSYGSKAREWQMDTVGLMRRVKGNEKGLSFSLEFTKARERTPENETDFAPVTMRLIDDQWAHSETVDDSKSSLSPNQKTMLNIVADGGTAGLSTEEWNEKARAVGIGVSRRATLSDVRRELKDKKLVYEFNERWFITNQ